MVFLHPLKILRSHIGHSDEVTIKEGQAVIIILDGQAAPHVGSNHIHEAKIAVIGAAPDAVKDSTLELHPQFLVKVLVKLDDFLPTVCMLYQQFNLFVCHGKGKFNNVPYFFPIDGHNLVPGHKLQFLSQTARIDSEDNTGVCSFAHIFLAHTFFLNSPKPKNKGAM